MKPELRSLAISTTVVVGYPIAIYVAMIPSVIFYPKAIAAFDRMWFPLQIPMFIMRVLYGSESVAGGRMPIEHTLMLLGWFIVFNVTLYYLPIRLFVQWGERRRKLP